MSARKLPTLIVAGALAGVSLLAAPGAPAPSPPKIAVRIDSRLGTFHRPLATTKPLAQQYFDQGMRLFFAFNLEAAQQSFSEAARLDPACALCEWGIAMSLSPHLNMPGLPERTRAAHRAAVRAQRAAHASPVERALIAAVAARSSDPPPSDAAGQAALDVAYAVAMRDLARRFPDDLDIAALAAEAAMDVHPWDYWKANGEPQAWTPDIERTLERVLEREPDHPGANHYYIHLLEASPHPEQALAAAERLPRLEPGAAHLVHMPSHIYLRLGRYEEAAAANRSAVAIDLDFIGHEHPQGLYLMYAAHNHFFLSYAAMMEGRSAEAYTEARHGVALTSLAELRENPGFDGLLETPLWMLIRFHRDSAALAEPAPPPDLLYATAVWHAARGIALARRGKLEEADQEHRAVENLVPRIPRDAPQGFNTSRQLLDVALPLLEGTIAVGRAQRTTMIASFRAAVAAVDRLRYDEPPDWYYPVRMELAGALRLARQPAEAERVCRADIARQADTGWNLVCLDLSLRQQGKTTAAEHLDARFHKAWAHADLAGPPPS